ncbi:MAG: Gfo/Idh/MocA family protein [Anaerolineae bacterium]
MPEALRFGVIGCGEIAEQTCAGIDAAQNASIAMLMDSRPEVLSDLSELYTAPTTTNVADVFANPHVDAVYVATPHALHAALGIRAAEAGKHVLMEKPITTTLADADALIQACRANGVKLGVAFYGQVDAGLAAARDLVRAGMLGDIISVRIDALGDKPAHYWTSGYSQRVKTDWRQRKDQAGGGVLIMNAIHDLNTMRWVTGLEVTRVYAEMDTFATDVEVEDTAAAVLRLSNGAIGVIHAGSAMRGGAHQDMGGPRIYGAKGQLILGGSATRVKPIVCLTEPTEGGRPGVWQELRFSGPQGDREQIVARFADAVLRGAEPPTTGEDGRKALEIVLAAYRSAETGQPVTLPL